ncbi:exocyst complex component EXO70C1-like [Gastrolobium bilobum]|uniref:exocyst complex component EXO70C1-like n=1 Tax=Gastrolobium bilobum TaxID=150636 RepID=UPI002AB2362A|nr:exocyst complex component EXO70C1-like [Gastrolobium bilobum]
MDKSSSFSSRNNSSNVGKEALPQVLEEVDRFLDNNNAATPMVREVVPDCVLLLSNLLDSMVDKYNININMGRHMTISKFGHDPEDEKSFLDAVDRISKLCTTLSCSSALDKTSSVLQKAMSFLEKDLCALLQDPKHKHQSKTHNKSSSFGSLQDSDLCANIHSESPAASFNDHDQNEDFPSFSKEKLSILNKIATAMILSGYQTECCMAFAHFRRSAFKTVLQSFGYANVTMEDIHRMQWESLEGEIMTWNKVVRHCTTVLFNAERRLYESVFPNQPSISQTLFSDIARAVIIHFLTFAQGVALTKPSAEKLFKFLDMYETLREVEVGVIDVEELAYETATTKDRIVEVVVAMFSDLENSIKSDNERVPVPNGAVHPLTRYVMNYLKYACEYKDTLEHVFQQCLNVEGMRMIRTQILQNENIEDDGTPKNSPFAVQLMTIMNILDANVEKKSKLYRDPALRYVFLMNNGRYMVQKIKGCAELHESMGDNWCRRRQSGLRLYHKNYQRETWSKVLRCLNPEGSGNKVSKQVLKEWFKSFNAMFEEIHRTQSTWMVSDEQLQSELRVSISALVIPAYRSFLGRFKHHLELGRHVDKYIKYHPEDIEILIDDFFDGNATSMARRRT